MADKIQIEKLPDTFDGRAEVKGFTFTKIVSTEKGFIFKVNTGEADHYEVFKYKLTPVCLDFEKRIYADDQFKEHYPKRNAFGVWAWTTLDYVRAQAILKSFKDVKPKT